MKRKELREGVKAYIRTVIEGNHLATRWLGLIVISLLLMPFTSAAQGQYHVNGGYIVDFVAYEHDLVNCTTTFYYEVQNNNSDPAISHFTFGSADCNATCLDELPDDNFGTWDYDAGGFDINPGNNSFSGYDPGTHLCGIKYDKILNGTNTINSFITVDGIQHPGWIDIIIKAGTNEITAAIPGPTSCSGSCEGLNFYKTVNRDTVVAGDTVVYKFEIDKIWNNSLTNVTFTDVLEDGMVWVSEPANLTNGIVLGSSSITGQTTATFNIASLRVGISSFEIKASTPNPYLGSNPNMNQAWLSDLPAVLDNNKPSDFPATTQIDDATPLVILSEDDCIGDYNTPTINVDFKFNHRHVNVYSNRKILNVVLKLNNGQHRMIQGQGAYSGTFSDTTVTDGNCLTGVWVRTACNASGDGPEYGKYFESAIWDGLCGGLVPVVEVVSFEHGSTVVINGGTTVIDVGDYDQGPAVVVVDNDDDDIHNSGGVHVPRPEIPGRDRIGVVTESNLNIYPNPARAHSTINIQGLDNDTEWVAHIMSVSGKYLAVKPLYNRTIDLSGLNLGSGIYFCTLENGQEKISVKLMVYE